LKGFKTAKALGLDVPSQAAARARQSATLPPRRRITFPGLGNNRIWLSTQAIKAGFCDQRYGAQMVVCAAKILNRVCRLEVTCRHYRAAALLSALPQSPDVRGAR